MGRNYTENNDWFNTSRYKQDVEWDLILRFFRDHYPQYKTSLVQVLGVAFLFSITGFAIPKIFGKIQEYVTAQDVTMAVVFFAAYLGVVMVQQGLNYIMTRVQAYIRTGLDKDVTLTYYGRLLDSAVPEFLRFQRESNVFQRVIDAMSITGQFTGMLVGGVMQFLTAVVFFVVIATISPMVSLVLAVGTIVLGIYTFAYSGLLRDKHQKTLSINYPLVSQMLDILDGLLTVKALSASIGVTDDIREKVEAARVARYDEKETGARIDAIAKVLKNVVLIAAVGIAFYGYLIGNIELSQFFAVYVLAQGFLGPAKFLVELYKQMSVMSVNLKNFYEVIDIEQESPYSAMRPAEETSAEERGAEETVGVKATPGAATGDGAPTLPSDGEAAVGDGQTGRPSTIVQPRSVSPTETSALSTGESEPLITFDNVWFSYTDDEVVLKDISFDIYSGERVAFIGRSGVGKTTIFRLLLAYIDPDEGEVRVAGENLKDVLDKDAYRQQFGIVGQDGHLFNITLRDNITFGLHRNPSDEEIMELLREVNLRDEIAHLADGLDTVYDDNIFSGGQKQRLLVARAMVRHPRISLLDEPTSSLDFENERIITESIDQLVDRNTSLTIAHRLSTVQKADRIIVVDDGSVRAQGQHDVLYETDDYYRSLCDYNSFIA